MKVKIQTRKNYDEKVIQEMFKCKLKRVMLVAKNEYSSRRLHKTGGKRNPNKMWNCNFCQSTRILGPNYLGFWDC